MGETWFRRGRISSGIPAAALRYRAYQQKMRLRQEHAAATLRASAIVTPLAAPPAVWRPLGPSPLASDASGFGQQDYNWVSGRATALAIDRADPSGNTLYLGGAYGGVWKSTNATAPDPSSVVWIPLTDDQPTLAVGAIAVQPQVSNPDPSHSVILAGTGEANSSTDSYYGLGILRSTDAGAHWTLISQDTSGRHFAGMAFSKIAFSSANSNLAVVATAGASQGLINGLANPPTANLGLYYSTDGGASWTYASVTDGSTAVTAASATSVAYNDVAGTFIAALRSHGFYSSSDGTHWMRLASQPGTGLTQSACPANASALTCPIYRGEIAVVPGRNEMYAWYVDANDGDQGIWRTNDGGASWTQISTTSIAACGDSDGCGTENGSYNLTLAAVSNGATGTDLYAGAVNLYKCSINSQSPACNGPNTFLNLTHAYGCAPNLGAPAHVHPAQHAMDSLVVNGHAILYFANDGGAYRALDGYAGLTSGSCGTSNPFDSLNQTLGSMAQFMSFAQHPNDANTVLGGAQGNGSPATAEALVSSGWRNVNSGDGGPAEINPDNPAEWFTSNPGVNIQHCTLGVECHAQDFAAEPVITSATLGEDGGPFYTPFILDPQNSGQMIVGTCRVWRGDAGGTGFSALTNNFDTGSDTICTGGEANLVRFLAAGGPENSSGHSQVIYAGTDGFGPLVTTVPAAGRLWVTTNADGGTNSWSDRTGAINPQHFPVSAIAMDNSDATGTRAYVGLMGFNGPRVWMTPSAGVSWFDFTGNLPPAPVNTLVVDPGPTPTTGTIYAGTDVGVFVSSTATPNWTEVAPVGTAGFLPNVPVSALRIFRSGVTKLLRASTYGRGLWQFPLTTAADFQLAVPDPIQTIFAGQTASFSGVITEFNDYSNPVSLSCVAGDTAPPSTCSVSPPSVLPGASGVAFTLSARGSVGDYFFHLRGSGTDPSNITRDAALTLHVIDFGLGSPNPPAVGVNPGDTSPAVALQVTALGFQGGILLSCAGLPAGAACNFAPSDNVSPTAGNPVAVSLTISTSNTTPPGSFPVEIHASTPGAPDKTQTLSLVVGKKEYAISITNPSLTAVVNTSATFNGLLTTTNNYDDPVHLSCGTGAPPTCSVSSATVTPSVSGTPFTIMVASTVVQAYSFRLMAQGTDILAVAHDFPVTLQTIFDFSIIATPDSRTVTAGQSATYSLDIAPQGGNFVTSVALACSGLPAKTSCAFSPTQLSAGSGETVATLTIITTAAHAAVPRGRGPWYALWLVGAALLAGGAEMKSRNRRIGVFVFMIALLIVPVACGGGLEGGGPPPPPRQGTTPGTYLVTVNADAGSVRHSVVVTCTVQ